MNEYKSLNAIINYDNERIIGAILTSSYKDFQNFINSFFYIRIKEGNIYFINEKGEKITIKSQNDYENFINNEYERGKNEMIFVYIENTIIKYNDSYFINDDSFKKFSKIKNKFSTEDDENINFSIKIDQSIQLEIFDNILNSISILFDYNKDLIEDFINQIEKIFMKVYFKYFKNIKDKKYNINKPKFKEINVILNKELDNDKNQDTKIIECNKCKLKPLIAIIYKCQKCNNYNICCNCYEKNINIPFHNHPFDIIRESKLNMIKYNFSYECLNSKLDYIYRKKDIKDFLNIDDIIIKNNGIYEWLGNNETKFKPDKIRSSILCDTVFLPSLIPQSTFKLKLHFFKMKSISIGKYECYLNFILNNVIFGKPLIININIIK
jgi:hypothetical protein